ncbi:MAG TPA: sulfite exporter TauE/SafE family protein [Acetobacteraceae bacterium]|jgi:uncharacterized membrane protein YfcA|nr:sulfite exporter TauE/SafE family protein [Acetobacteraceae bacterium]
MHGAWLIDPLYAVSGLLVGILVGLTGVGGGSLMTPLLILIFGMHPASAVGTDLLYAAITKSAGTITHHSNNAVAWRIVGWLAVGSLPATILTILALRYLGTTGPGAASVISITLGVALVLTAGMLLFKGPIVRAAVRRNPDFGLRTSITATIAVGFVVGVLVSISSVGAGAVGTCALFFLYPRLPAARIVGTDIAHAVPLTLLAGLGHAWLGTVHLHILVSLLAGSIPGIVVGSLATRFTSEAVLRPALAVVLALVGVKLLG